MQIISSLIVAYVGDLFGISYKNQCHSTRFSNANSEFELTTVQQVFPQIPMPLDENKISFGEIVFDLCQRCVDQETDPNFIKKRQEMKQQNMEDTYHCLLFPNIGDVHTGIIQWEEGGISTEEILDKEDRIVHTALGAVLPLLRNRLYLSSIDWSPRAHIPSYDPIQGAVIYIDATQSLPIPFYFYTSHLPPLAKRVSIISSPTCVVSENCYTYGFQLKKHLHENFHGMNVSFDLISSTATAYSRMIMAHILICPPGTITCLLPALARQDTKKSIIFESSSQLSTFHWFKYLAKSASISIVPVDDDVLHTDYEQSFIEKQSPLSNNEDIEGDESSNSGRSAYRFESRGREYNSQLDNAESETAGHNADLGEELFRSKASADNNLVMHLPISTPADSEEKNGETLIIDTNEENDETEIGANRDKGSNAKGGMINNGEVGNDETEIGASLDKIGITKGVMKHNGEIGFDKIGNTDDKIKEEGEIFFENVNDNVDEKDKSEGELRFVTKIDESDESVREFRSIDEKDEMLGDLRFVDKINEKDESI